MKIKKLMTKVEKVCGPDESLAKAAEIMQADNCAYLAVVDKKGNAGGIICDRDIALFTSKLDKKPSEVKISEVMTGEFATCEKRGELNTALKIMKRKGVRQVIVLGRKGKVSGVLTINDILLSPKIDKALLKLVRSTLKSISRPSPIVLTEITD